MHQSQLKGAKKSLKVIEAVKEAFGRGNGAFIVGLMTDDVKLEAGQRVLSPPIPYIKTGQGKRQQEHSSRYVHNAAYDDIGAPLRLPGHLTLTSEWVHPQRTSNLSTQNLSMNKTTMASSMY